MGAAPPRASTAPNPPEPTTNPNVQPRPAGGKRAPLQSNLNRVGLRGRAGRDGPRQGHRR
jgi:hypothetical protein